MNILSLDTALAACSVVLRRDGAVDAGCFSLMDRGQSEAIMPMVRQVMTEAGARFADIDLVAVTIGPGAFTGLRIGLAAARGLALAAGLPCLGVTTLDAVAAGVGAAERRAGTVLVVLETKRADVYAQFFDGDLNALDRPRAVAPERLVDSMPPGVAGALIVAGNAAPRVVAVLEGAGVAAPLSAAPGLPDASVIARIAARRWRPGQILSPPSPLYLRPPAVTRPLA
ncbi:MAG: tRNA (adenosine(37)-N6)-threonylcarbamoyltransferase complex dimerization subunit type 1 TsaB [Rhodospirillales bacterium]|nr:tRNA (adenosine(37)-N6)-threonylcarbamoyltransferase complex dimerization subunit type 1 TsaB [Rhodospirillales bacterium]